MNPVIFEIGPFSLYWYGVFIVGGAVIAAWFASRYAAQEGEEPDHIWNLLAVSLVFGIIGARLYHVFSSPAEGLGWNYYRQNPVEIFNFWSGGFRGLGIFGGIAGGVLGVWLYCWWQKLDVLQYLDFIAPNVLLAQAIGRLGNYVNQELYGPPTDLPWAFHINPAYPCQLPRDLPPNVQFCSSTLLTEETVEWYATHGFHPTFFYEAGWNLLMFGILTYVIWQFGHRLRRGDAAILYILAYSVGRFWVEMLRPDAWMLGNLATAQWIALVGGISALALLFVRHRHWKGQGVPKESLVLMSRHRSTVAPDVQPDRTADPMPSSS